MPNKGLQTQDFTDIPSTSWLDRYLPEASIPYAKTMRLDRPIGFLLLAFPGWWAIAFTADFSQMGFLFFLFGLGSILMRGAGCAYNDWVDMDLDQQVTRTKSRPLASGQLKQFDVLKLIAGLLFISLLILVLLPLRAIELGFLSIIPVAIYPWMKRFTYWPQFFLGIAFNWGALLGWAAATGDLTMATWCLYIAGIFWTLTYDTIYAHQDKEDDLLIGIKSTAIKFGESTRSVLLIFTIAMYSLLLLVGYNLELGLLYIIITSLVALGMSWQILQLNFNNPSECLKAFKQQAYVGWALLLGILVARIFSL